MTRSKIKANKRATGKTANTAQKLWYLVGLHGFRLTDDEDGITHPIFGDATLCSIEAITRLISRELREDEAKHTLAVIGVKNLLGLVDCSQVPYSDRMVDFPPDSFIAVQRTPQGEPKAAFDSARNRAEEIAATTAMEILLVQSSNFQLLQSRLKVLLPLAEESHSVIDRLMQNRHDFVHDGKEPSKEAADTALGLATYVLWAYCAVCKKYPSRDYVIQYLDFISAGLAMKNAWSSDMLAAFRKTHEVDSDSRTPPLFMQNAKHPNERVRIDSPKSGE